MGCRHTCPALRKGVATLALAFGGAQGVQADPAEDAFVEANLIGIFYHELGHALIDQLQLPVFGQEEDAADVLSIFLIDHLWEAETALDLAYDAAFGFAAEAIMAEQEGAGIAYWDVHGPDVQRFFNTVCVFYGADPEARDDFAEDMGLPEERAETCAEEYDLAAASWGPVLEELDMPEGALLRLIPGDDAFGSRVIGDEVVALNDVFRWPNAVTVSVEACGEPNAFYSPDDVAIVICTEFAPYLRQLFQLGDS